MSINQPDAARSSTTGPPDLEPAVAIARRERSHLLRHLIAKDDEIAGYQQEQSSLRRERDDLRGRLAQRDDELQSRQNQAATRSRVLRVFAYVGAAIVGAVVSAMVFDRTAYRPMQVALQDSVATLDTRVKQGEADNQRLQTELAAVQESLKNAAIGGAPTSQPPLVDLSLTDDLAALRKALADRMTAVDLESKRLAQVRRELDLENEKLLAGRTTLDKDRAAFQLDRKNAAAIVQAIPPNAGVMIWSGTTTVPTAVMVNMSKANFGMTSGALPGREASVDIIVRVGTIKVFERPDASNKWSRFYFQVQGPGPALIYVIWTLTG